MSNSSNKKKLNYLLLFAVTGLWAIVLYKLFGKQSAQDTFADHTNTFQAGATNKVIETKDYELKLGYQDPFLKGNTFRRTKKPTTTKPLVPKPIQRRSIPLSWPNIKYSGLVTNKQSNRRIALLAINQHHVLLKENEKTNHGIELSKAYPDSVVSQWKNEKKVIEKTVDNQR